MDLLPRHQGIMQLARKSGRVMVDELAAHFAVTPQTIRRDLAELCDGGMLRRMHGGAVLSSGTENMAYEQRRQLCATEKAAIGRAAAALIPEQASLFITIGTTTEAVGQALLGHDSLMVITNNINVGNRMRVFPRFEVVIAGGSVRASDGGIVGAAAADFMRQFKVDYAVIGTSGIDDDGSLLDYDLREVKVAQAIIDNARHIILVSDRSKFGRPAPVRIGHLSQIDSFVTDRCDNEAIRAICAAHDVTLIETEAG